METRLIPYTLVNMFGSVPVLVLFIFYVLHERGKLGPKTFKIVLAIFAMAMLAYGIYQVSVADLLQKVYPGKYYTVGGGIAISIAIVILISIFLGFKKKKGKRGQSLA